MSMNEYFLLLSCIRLVLSSQTIILFVLLRDLHKS